MDIIIVSAILFGCFILTIDAVQKICTASSTLQINGVLTCAAVFLVTLFLKQSSLINIDHSTIFFVTFTTIGLPLSLRLFGYSQKLVHTAESTKPFNKI